MTVSQSARDAWRSKWRELVKAATDAAEWRGTAPELAGLAKASKDWVMPSGERADELACVALAAVARAWCASSTITTRQPIAPALKAMAATVAKLVEGAPPAGAALPRYVPGRDD
jgi:hypothetical protein